MQYKNLFLIRKGTISLKILVIYLILVDGDMRTRDTFRSESEGNGENQHIFLPSTILLMIIDITKKKKEYERDQQ